MRAIQGKRGSSDSYDKNLICKLENRWPFVSVYVRGDEKGGCKKRFQEELGECWMVFGVLGFRESKCKSKRCLRTL